MNYNSIEEIISAGIDHMTVIRNNSKNDDETDTLTGVDWFTFNGTVASRIYVSGNSWFGFGTSSEQLKVNRRDTAVWSEYREEGTLFDYYRFLKIRWSGYSSYYSTSTSAKMTYDVILWDTGDISLHMVDVPTSDYSGTFNLLGVTYTTPTSDSPDVTFKVQEDNSFVSSNELINLQPPYDRKFLIKSGDTLFTIQNDVLVELTETELTAELFRTEGVDDIPSSDLLITLEDPEVFYFADTTDYPITQLLARETAVPHPQTLVSDDYYMTHATIIGIECVTAECSDDVLFAVSFDSGITWKLYTGTEWATLSESDTGMSAEVMNAISSETWNEQATTGKFRFRVTLPDDTSTFTSLVVDYLN